MDNRYLLTDVEGYVKDSNSGAVLNTDTDGLESYKKRKQFFENTRNSTERINKIENDVRDIKKLLQQILELKNK
jgi:hypothetical protein